MGKVKLDPYIFFDGDCKQAMEYYKNIFGGELTLSTFADMPGSTPETKDRIMHANLITSDFNLLASDGIPGKVSSSSRIELALSGDDDSKLRQMFDNLAKDGKVSQPLEKQAWGDVFGKLVDKYGIDWMFNIATAKE